MSLVAQVAAAVSQCDRGRCTIEQLETMIPGVPRHALQKALENASFRGEIRLLMRGGSRGPGKGMAPGVYGPVPQWERFRRIPLNARRPVSSVWELGR